MGKPADFFPPLLLAIDVESSEFRPDDMMGAMAVAWKPILTRGLTREVTAQFGAWMVSERKRVFLLCHRMLRRPGQDQQTKNNSLLRIYQYFTNL